MNAEFDLPSNRNVSISTSNKTIFFCFSYKITLNSCTSCNGVVQFIRWYGLFMQSTITFGKKQFVLFALWLSRQLYLSSGCWRIAYAVCSLCWRIIKIDQKTEIWYSNCVGVSSLFLWFHRVYVCGRWALCVLSAFDANGVSIIPLVVFVCHEHH